MLAGENVAVTPCGAPVTVNFSDDLKPFCADPQLTSVDAAAPVSTAILAGVAAKLHPTGVETVSDTGNGWLTAPPWTTFTCTMTACAAPAATAIDAGLAVRVRPGEPAASSQ